MKNKLLKDSAILFMGTILNSILMFLMQVLLTRSLSIAEYGSLVTSFNIVNLMAIFVAFGTGDFILKSFGQEGPGAYRWIKVFSKIVPITILFSISILIVIITSDLFEEKTSFLLLMLIPNVIFQGLLPLTISIYQIEKKYKKIAYLNSLVYLVRFLSVLVGIYFEKSVEIIGYTLFVFSIIALIYFLKQLKRYYIKDIAIPIGNYQKKDYIPTLTKAFKGVAPYGFLVLFYYLFYQSDIILIGLYLDEESVGYYNIAFTIISLSYLLPKVVLGQLFLPRLHFWVHNDKNKVKNLFIKGNKIMLFLGILVLIIILLINKFIIDSIFGEQYTNSAMLLMVFSCAIPFRYLQSVSDAIMNTENRIITKTYIFLIVSFVNILLNVLLLPKIGVLGAVLSTVFSEMLLLFLTFIFCYKYIKTIDNDIKEKK